MTAVSVQLPELPASGITFLRQQLFVGSYEGFINTKISPLSLPDRLHRCDLFGWHISTAITSILV